MSIEKKKKENDLHNESRSSKSFVVQINKCTSRLL